MLNGCHIASVCLQTDGNHNASSFNISVTVKSMQSYLNDVNIYIPYIIHLKITDSTYSLCCAMYVLQRNRTAKTKGALASRIPYGTC